MRRHLQRLQRHVSTAAAHASATSPGTSATSFRHRHRVALRVATSLAATGSLLYIIDQTNAKILSRSGRVFATGGRVVLEYREQLKGMDREDPLYKETLRVFNAQTAQHLLHLCFQNGGIYTKFGQQLATFNHGLPKEYTETLATLQDQAKPVAFDQVARAIQQELGGTSWEDHFQQFEEIPIAAASLAQVHRAVDRQGRDVAVKVQYPHLAQQMKADIVVMRWAFQLTEYFFPNIQIQWMFPEFENALHAELNFENEKENSRRIAKHLKHNPCVHVPIVYDELSTQRIMTMEFIDHAPKISQVDAIRDLGLDTPTVSRVLCEVFSEMIFCHGFVHCDPHAGNIFVRVNPDPNAPCKEQIVLLDHGLYRNLDEGFRRTYCDLWRAMLLRNNELLMQCGEKLNIGEYAKYLPLLLTYRTVRSNAPLTQSMSEKEAREVLEDLKKLNFSNVTDFLEQLPRDMLFVFRTNNMIRALNKDLGGTTRERFAIMGKYAVEGHTLFHSASTYNTSFTSHFWYWVDHYNLLFHLNVVDWALGIAQYVRGDTPAKPRFVG